MSKRMLISVDRDESRAAVVEDGQLVHLEIEPVNRNTNKGNIYRAVVARVEQSLQSAFVDFGNDKQGFLPVGEIHPKLRGGNNDRRAPIQDILKSKTEILVQVVRDEIGQKGATLSTFVSLPGRYLVLIPESDKTGVSRKLSEEARDRIKNLTERMQIPEGFGLIVRTAGETATEKELEKDLLYLSRQWAHITKRFEESKGPSLLYAERSLPVRFVRDYFTRDIDEVVIDDDATLHEVGEFLQVLMPRGLAAMHRYQGDVPLFARYGVEGKVEDVFARQVFMAGGGSIVIDQTEALVSIDVNSGRQKEKDIEETARATNIEAAQEIARQMILRDMGGLIVIDFIDMREKKYVREVEQALKDAFKNDKARTKIAHISEFGLLEMSRQRIKSSVNKGAFDSCPHCSGTGRIRAMESVGMAILRRIYELVAQKKVRYVIAMIPPQAARYLLNSRRAELAAIEKQYHMTIEVVPVDGMPSTQVVMEHLEDIPEQTGAEKSDKIKVLRVTQELDLVRNQLIKREEARIQLEAQAARRGAKVDYAEIYREVREMTPDTPAGVDPEPRAPRQHRRNQGNQQQPQGEAAPLHVAAIEAAPQQIAEPEWEDLPQQKGIWASIKSLFGMSEPPQRVQVTRPQIQALTPAPSIQPAKVLPPAGQSMANATAELPAQPRPEHQDRRPDRRDRHERRDRRDGGEAREGQPAREPREPREGQQAREPREPREGQPAREPREPREGQQAREPREPREPRDGRRRQEAAAQVEPASRGDALRVEVPAQAEDRSAVGTEPLQAGADEGGENGGRRRRRRRRRGGQRDAQGQMIGDDLAADGSEGGGDEGEDETVEAREATGPHEAQDAESAPVEGETDESADASAHRRRRRRGRGERSNAEVAVEAAAEVSHAGGSDQPAEGPAADEAVVAAPAEEAKAAPESVEAAAPEADAVIEAAEEPAEVAVDAQALVQAEIERLKSEQAPPAEAAAPAEAVTAPDAEVAKPAATKRFVVDLRTGR
jgi:ribonuclease E